MDIIQFLYSIIGTPLGYVLWFIYNYITDNVGIAILLFTFIIKLAMLPLAIKQQQNTAKNAIFAPKVRDIQTKYKNNQEKQQEEMLKLQQQGYKPMGGCGTMLLTFLLLFGVLDVVYKPMTHIGHFSSSEIDAVITESYDVELTSAFVNEVSMSEDKVLSLKTDALNKHNSIVADAERIIAFYNENCLSEGESAADLSAFNTLDVNSVRIMRSVVETAIMQAYAADNKSTTINQTDLYIITDAEKEEMNALSSDDDKKAYRAEHSFSDATTAIFSTLQKHYGSYVAKDAETVSFNAASTLQRELYALECYGTTADGVEYKSAYSAKLSDNLKNDLSEIHSNLNFLGIPLGQVPWDNLGFPIILVPIISFLMALAQTFISNKLMEKSNPDAAQAMGAMKITMYVMPVFSLWLAFTIPAGAGFYWTISYVFGIIQTILLNIFFSPQKLRERAQLEYDARMKLIEEQESRVRDSDRDETISEYKGEKLTQKEINRRKLAEARRQDAIKYGEEYNEDDDE